MAVLLKKPPVTFETVNDLHGDLVNLARVLQDESTALELYRRLSRTLAVEDLFRESIAIIRASAAPEALNLDRAYHYFVSSWTGMNGVAGTFSTNTNFARRFSSAGGAPGTRFRSAVESIPDWHVRLRGVMILRGDAFSLLESIEDRAGTVVYVDPPYFTKGAKYVHDFNGTVECPASGKQIDRHELLSLHLRWFRKTRVVVSYYDHPRLAELYPGWRKIDCAVAKSLVNAGQRTKGRTEAPEVLLVNQG